MGDIAIKILKGTVIEIEGYAFQLTSSLKLPVNDKILKIEGHTLIDDFKHESSNERTSYDLR